MLLLVFSLVMFLSVFNLRSAWRAIRCDCCLSVILCCICSMLCIINGFKMSLR